jgi:hypothetical protein
METVRRRARVRHMFEVWAEVNIIEKMVDRVIVDSAGLSTRST